MTTPYVQLARLAKPLLLALSLLLPMAAQADTDADGFTRPLDSLKFNPGLDQTEFERATLEALEIYDPWERFNRHMYHFNYRLDEWVLLPVVRGYMYVTPRFVRSGVSNFFGNLGDIPNLLNSALQLKGKRSLQTTGRLLVNTTVGVFGLWDPASHIGLPKQSEDFGQTLGFYGVGDGPYLVLPFCATPAAGCSISRSTARSTSSTSPKPPRITRRSSCCVRSTRATPPTSVTAS